MASSACPNGVLASHVARMLNTSGDVADTAQRTITNPATDTTAVLGRLAGLLAIVNIQSQALDDW